MSIEIIKKHVKEKNFAAIYAIYGEEGYLRRFYVGEIMKNGANEEFSDFNRTIFTEESFDLDEFNGVVESYPMFDEHRIVLVENYSPDAAAVKKIKPILEDIPTFTTVIFQWDESIEAEKKCPAFLKTIKACGGIVCQCKRPNISSLSKWAIKHFAAYGKTIDKEALMYLINEGEKSMDLLQQEIVKISNFTQGNQVSVKEIKEVIAPALEDKVFALTDALIAGDGENAIRIFRDLIEQKYDPVFIESAISSNISRLHKVKQGSKHGLFGRELLDFTGIKSEWALKKSIKSSEKVSEKYLQMGLDYCLEADISLKSSRMDRQIIMEMLIGKLLDLYNK